MATLKLADFDRIIKEAVEDGIASKNGKLFTNMRSENEKESNNTKKDAEERIKASTPTSSSTQVDGYRGDDANAIPGRNALNLDYDSMDKKYQGRVKALVQGKASPEQADIDDEASGVSTKGNKKFYEKMQNDNKGYANVMGTTQINDRIAQPNKHQKPQFPTENKARVGDVFTETKNNLKLQITGLNEDKSRVTFIDESGKKYSLSVDNFKKAVREDKMIRENREQLNEYAALIARAVAPIVRGIGGAIAKKGATGAAAAITKKGSKELLKKAAKDIATEVGTNAAVSATEKIANKMAEKPSKNGKKERKRDFLKRTLKDVASDALLLTGEKVGEKISGKKGNTTSESNQSKMKRLKFNKTTFISETHAISLIPEQYKTPGNKFMMIDKDHNEYLIECNDSNKPVILEYKNTVQAKSEFERMKQLWEYDTAKAVGGTIINEAKTQVEIQNKIQKLSEKKVVK